MSYNEVRQARIPGLNDPFRHIAIILHSTPAPEMRESKCPGCKRPINDGTDQEAAQLAVHDSMHQAQLFDPALASGWGHRGCIEKLFTFRVLSARGMIDMMGPMLITALEQTVIARTEVDPTPHEQKGRQRDFLDFLQDVVAPGSDVLVNYDYDRGSTERYHWRVAAKESQ